MKYGDHYPPPLLSRREYIAIHALNGYLAGCIHADPTPEDAAIKARMFADALIAELDRPKSTPRFKK